MFLFFFFFQAEDGIRDTSVTGVQTCALPISRRGRSRPGDGRCQPLAHGARRPRRRRPPAQRGGDARLWSRVDGGGGRSEERRVGKEWRWGGVAGRYKKRKEGMAGR